MNDELTAAFADCLDRIEAGAAPEAAIAAQPAALRDELRVLVAFAAAARALPAAAVRPGFRAALQGELARREAEAHRGWRADAVAGIARDPATDAAVPASAAGAGVGRLVEAPGLGASGGATPTASAPRRWRWHRLSLSPAAVLALVAVTAFAAGRGWPADGLAAARDALRRAWDGTVGRPAGIGTPAAIGDRDPVSEGGSPAPATAVNRAGAGTRDLRAATAAPAPDARAPGLPGRVSVGSVPGVDRAAIADAAAASPRAVAGRVAGTRGIGESGGATPTAAAPTDAPAPATTASAVGGSGRRAPGGGPRSTDTPAPTAAPSATATAADPGGPPTPTPVPARGPFVVTGFVKQQAAAVEPLPLEGVTVSLVRVDTLRGCQAGPPAPVAQTTTGADGSYAFTDVPGGTYVVAVERARDAADPDCRPLRWRTASHLGVAAFCDALPSAIALDDQLGPARTAANVNVLYEELDRCAGAAGGW